MASNITPKSISAIILGIARIVKFPRALSTKPSEGLCSSKANRKGKKKKWFVFSKKECQKPEKTEEKSPPELCRERTEDPDLSSFGGTPYRTCGSAYIIQKERLADPKMKPEDAEQKILDNLEKHPDLKNVEDTMPPFESVEKRMLDLDERKLHPLYKKYIFLPKKPSKLPVPKFTYKSRSGPVSSDEIPLKLKCKEYMEKKNIFYDFKRVDPPRQLLARMLEMQLNEKPTMEKKSGPKNVNELKVDEVLKV
nr:uncharacterized protein LOC111512703 [Leptinotarsa decemlineata]